MVQDKLFLPGLRKIAMLRDAGFFGRILSVRGEFGYWVFEGDWGQPAQRPSWNYKKAEGGGIILDMLCHWRYVLDNLFGAVQAVSCLGATHIPSRVDENGKTYTADTDYRFYVVGANGLTSSQLTSLVSGKHTLRVWYSGPDKARVAGDPRSAGLPEGGHQLLRHHHTSQRQAGLSRNCGCPRPELPRYAG